MNSRKNCSWYVALTLLLSSSVINAEPLDRIVAVVNEDVITFLELDSEFTKLRRTISAQKARLPSDEILRRQVLERMVLLQIQLQRAEKRRIRIDDESLNRALNRIAEQNKMELPQLREALEREGNNYEEFRATIREQMIVTRLQQREVESTITVTEQEVENFLETKKLRGDPNTEYRLQHILISVPESASSEQIQASKQEAQELFSKISQGEEFFQLAISHSDGQQALNGGDLGWRKSDSIPSLFANEVVDMKVGMTSSVIRSPSGFHIVHLAEKRSNVKPKILKQFKSRHILIKVDDVVSNEKALEKAEQLRLRLLQGEDFASLAKANSDDKGSGAEGGELGWSNPGQMVQPFEKAVNSLDLGKLSKPVLTDFGWHLIEVLDRRDFDNSDAYTKNQSRNTLRNRKLEPALDNWRRRLRDEAFVQIKF